MTFLSFVICSDLNTTPYYWQTLTRNPKHVIIAKTYAIFSKKCKYVIYRGKRKDNIFSKHVIFSSDRLHVRLEDYIWNLEITCFRY